MSMGSKTGSRSLLLRMVMLILPLSESIVQIIGREVGINYGQIADNLPHPSSVVNLLQNLDINRVKIYDADPKVLQAFSNSNVEFVIGLGNGDLPNVVNPANAQAWIRANVLPYINQTKISTINVGNEVFASNNTLYMTSLLPAMQSVYKALQTFELDDQVTVTSAHSLNILGSSFPPSSGTFQESLAQYIQPILEFQSKIKSPFLVNAYPFFAYKDNPQQVPLDYVLFKPNEGMLDPGTNLKYDNMLYAQIDAVYAAIRAMKGEQTDIEVRVSETGWPSKGDADEVGATPENAALYNGNLMRKIREQELTPGKAPVDVHVFALFNEDQKPGPTSERNYGLLLPTGQASYSLGSQAQGSLLEISASAPAFSALSAIGLSIILAAFLIQAEDYIVRNSFMC